MISNASRSFVMAKTLVLTLGGMAISFYLFHTINSALIGALIGFLLSWLWQ